MGNNARRKRKMNFNFDSFVEIGDQIEFNIFVDDSCSAVDMFGVEPQLDWWVEQLYIDTVKGEYKGCSIVKTKWGKEFDLSSYGVQEMVFKMMNILFQYEKTESFFIDNEEDEAKTIDSLFRIKNLTKKTKFKVPDTKELVYGENCIDCHSKLHSDYCGECFGCAECCICSEESQELSQPVLDNSYSESDEIPF